MRLTIEIECGNAAFDDDNACRELARILKDQAASLAHGTGPTSHAIQYGADDTSGLFDENGNRVGRIVVEQD